MKRIVEVVHPGKFIRNSSPSGNKAGKRIRVCASEKGKPVVRRGRKAQGPSSWEAAGLSNSSGGATKLRPYKEEWVRMRPDSSDIVHARLVP